MPYVSVTGLKVKNTLQFPRFWYHSVRSMTQAQSAAGCLAADARVIKGIHHTRSLWVSRDHMLAFLRSGAHLRAMQTYPGIGTGRVLGFEAEALPDWSETRRRWEAESRAI